MSSPVLTPGPTKSVSLIFKISQAFLKADVNEGTTLETIYPLEALRMALHRLEEGAKLIHHSDRGCQYASGEYVSLLKEYGIQISMTESGDPKENAQAERINNTMKNELLMGLRFESEAEAREAIAKAVDFYNNERPHEALGMRCPSENSFSCCGVLMI